MDTRQLLRFVTVARSQSLSEAADALAITQPGLTMSIQRLESSLGIALFNRVKGRLSLTDEGRALLPCAEAVLSSETQWRTKVKELTERTKKLRVAYCDPGPYWFFGPRLAAALSDTQIEAVVVPDDCTPEALRSGRYDIVVAGNVWETDKSSGDSPFETIPWVTDRTLLSLSAERPDAVRFAENGGGIPKVARIADLRDGDLVFLNLDGAFSRRKEAAHARLDPSVRFKVLSDFFLFRHELTTTQAATFTTELVQHYRDDGADRILVPIIDADTTIDYRLYWRRNDDRKTVRRYVQVAQQAAEVFTEDA